ncbi:MAG TPA: hypothetical protein VID50_02405 [Candidatus Eisenbacteria bacterium]
MRVQGEHEQYVELERSSFGEPGTPADRDLLLNIAVQVEGYSAADQAWVAAGEWRAFLTRLRDLERSRRGEAALEGASPRSLRLVFRSTDALGHMAVMGHVGWDTPDGFSRRLEFGFRFDPSLLPALVRDFEALGR